MAHTLHNWCACCARAAKLEIRGLFTCCPASVIKLTLHMQTLDCDFDNPQDLEVLDRGWLDLSATHSPTT